METLLILLFVACLFASGAVFGYNALPDFRKLNLSRRFEDELGAGRTPPGLVKMFRVPILLLSDLAAGVKLPTTRERYQQDLSRLGMEKLVSVDQMIALKLTLFFISCVYGVMLTAMVPFFFSIFLLLLGWAYVDIWLKDKIKQRKTQIRVLLPFLLDMLTLSVEAGLEFTAAVNKIVARMEPSALREELTIFLRQMQLGMSRRDALKAMSERADLPEMNSMVASLIQAAEMGSSIGGALRTQSEIMNAERFSMAEKKGAEASQKMLIPMILFIVPAIMLVILGPLVISFIYGAK